MTAELKLTGKILPAVYTRGYFHVVNNTVRPDKTRNILYHVINHSLEEASKYYSDLTNYGLDLDYAHFEAWYSGIESLFNKRIAHSFSVRFGLDWWEANDDEFPSFQTIFWSFILHHHEDLPAQNLNNLYHSSDSWIVCKSFIKILSLVLKISMNVDNTLNDEGSRLTCTIHHCPFCNHNKPECGVFKGIAYGIIKDLFPFPFKNENDVNWLWFYQYIPKEATGHHLVFTRPRQ